MSFATLSYSTRPRAPTQPLPERIAALVHEARWLVIAALGLYLALILIGFDKADPGWSQAADVDTIANPGGRFPARLMNLAGLESDKLLNAVRILHLGVKPHDRIVLQFPNRCEFVVSFYAMHRIGAVPVLAIPRHAHQEPHIVRAASVAQITAVLSEPLLQELRLALHYRRIRPRIKLSDEELERYRSELRLAERSRPQHSRCARPCANTSAGLFHRHSPEVNDVDAPAHLTQTQQRKRTPVRPD